MVVLGLATIAAAALIVVMLVQLRRADRASPPARSSEHTGAETVFDVSAGRRRT